MKRTQAESPYSDYWLYIVHHRRENRRMANLILKDNTKIRTTISYARYLMSVNMNRLLTEDEEVDHKDENKMNDDLSNLQILSKEENKKKQDLYRAKNNPPTRIELVCPMCSGKFSYASRNYRYHTKNGRTNFFCSRECSYEHMRT
jgi:hypothetical protein